MRDRFPSTRDLLAVFAVVATFVYGWTIVILFWKLPSFLLFATPGELFAITSYVLVSALIESLVVMGLLAGTSFLLPARFFRDDFLVRASWLVMIGYGSVMLFLKLNALFETVFGRSVDAWSAGTILSCLLAAWISPRIKFMRSVAEWVSDRFQVFLFLLIPLSLLSLVVVIIRNLS